MNESYVWVFNIVVTNTKLKLADLYIALWKSFAAYLQCTKYTNLEYYIMVTNPKLNISDPYNLHCIAEKFCGLFAVGGKWLRHFPSLTIHQLLHQHNMT